MELLSINKIAVLTGKNRKTIMRRLDGLSPSGTTDTRANGYDSVIALEKVYSNGDAVTGALGLATERARLAKEQADQYEIKNALARGELLPADEVMDGLVKLITAAKTRLMSIQAEVAPILLEILERPDALEIVERIDAAVKQALYDLSEFKYKQKGVKK